MPHYLGKSWFDAIVLENKNYVGCLNTKKWASLDIGDQLLLIKRSKKIKVEIHEIRHYDDFGQAWLELNKNLIPYGVRTIDEARSFYNTFYPNDNSIQIYGVIIFGLDLPDTIPM